ncbi:hypothetical protein B1207_08360 [Legionella quinlivanii]|uniref:Uncharacterized protein n=1 Tax=Legionella quinlivanii TaxID=45073 RepID=A0A364LJW0_9GAMM|nr:hypothetical protein [Legionella quinlivanii]RAP36800.1 hypothetical protein B1207_08360 [Legionella quinlivanii]
MREITASLRLTAAILFNETRYDMALFKKLRKFYRASAENRIQTHVFLAFLIIPVIGMIALYVWVNLFWLH